MKFDKNQYSEAVNARASRSPVLRNCFRAFWVGGVVCAFGQILFFLFRTASLPFYDSWTTVTVTLIFTAALLTGIGVFDCIAKYAGAGTLVPVTGFANAVVSPAIDNKSEGLILGVGAKIFTVAGPVILYGVLCGALYGVIYWLCFVFGWL